MSRILITLALCCCVFANQVFAETSVILPEQLLEQKQDNWLILDVRTPEEFAEGHVPGAINIAHSTLSEKLDDIVAYKDKPVVVYCRSGRRAAFAMDILTNAQFSDIRHLEGDMNRWVELEKPIETP